MAQTASGEKDRIADLISDRIDKLGGVKNQMDIAREVGYRNSNMITMIKQGDAKVALDRVPALARALEVDKSHLFMLALEQQIGRDLTKEILGTLGIQLSANEMEIVNFLRDVSGHADPELSSDMKKCLQRTLSKKASSKQARPKQASSSQTH